MPRLDHHNLGCGPAMGIQPQARLVPFSPLYVGANSLHPPPPLEPVPPIVAELRVPPQWPPGWKNASPKSRGSPLASHPRFSRLG